jgi:hypothetical protein
MAEDEAEEDAAEEAAAPGLIGEQSPAAQSRADAEAA